MVCIPNLFKSSSTAPSTDAACRAVQMFHLEPLEPRETFSARYRHRSPGAPSMPSIQYDTGTNKITNMMNIDELVGG